MAEPNQSLFDADAEHYAALQELDPFESLIIERFGARWGEMDVLDLGVGAGRTARAFAPIARSYLGLDYAPRMIELSRAAVPESDRVRFVVGDARDLSGLDGAPFLFVLFSFNGIDCVDHEGRLAVLAQIRSVLSDDGWFAFSSHSLAGLSLRPRVPRTASPKALLWGLRRGIGVARRMRDANPGLDLGAARRRGWVIVNDDPAHDFTLQAYYVDVRTQLRQLADAGFGDVEIFDSRGRPVTADAVGRDVWLHYLCRPV